MPDLGAARASVDKQSMRGFLAMVERDYPDELVRISQPVRRELDITATVFELERAGRSPVVVFERVEGFDMPVVTNIAGNRRLVRPRWGSSPACSRRAFASAARITGRSSASTVHPGKNW
jgi:2,5-furandicarboxylate decarboxylase 1